MTYLEGGRRSDTRPPAALTGPFARWVTHTAYRAAPAPAVNRWNIYMPRLCPLSLQSICLCLRPVPPFNSHFSLNCCRLFPGSLFCFRGTYESVYLKNAVKVKITNKQTCKQEKELRRSVERDTSYFLQNSPQPINVLNLILEWWNVRLNELCLNVFWRESDKRRDKERERERRKENKYECFFI